MSDLDMLHIQCPSDHGGQIITGDATMLIDGQPVARIGDLHSCPQFYPTVPPIPHAITPIAIGAHIQNRPLINGRPAAFEGDVTGCGAKLLKCKSSASGVGFVVGALALLLPFLFLKRQTYNKPIQSVPTPTQQADAIEKQITGLTDFINRNLSPTPVNKVAESKPTSCDCPPK